MSSIEEPRPTKETFIARLMESHNAQTVCNCDDEAGITCRWCEDTADQFGRILDAAISEAVEQARKDDRAKPCDCANCRTAPATEAPPAGQAFTPEASICPEDGFSMNDHCLYERGFYGAPEQCANHRDSHHSASYSCRASGEKPASAPPEERHWKWCNVRVGSPFPCNCRLEPASEPPAPGGGE